MTPHANSRTGLLSLGLAAAVLAFALATVKVHAVEQATNSGLVIEAVPVVEGLVHPWSIAFLPGGDMLITERPGRLRLVVDGRLVREPVAGVPAVVARGQGGLLDVAIGPRFGDDGEVFLSYSEAGEGGVGTAVARARLVRDGNSARLEDVRVIFRQLPKVGGNIHFGSRIVVARDGRLFVALGERGRKPMAQDLGSHLGKVIRIERDGSVPADNPFVGRADVRPEIWSYGHRNPQGAALHPRTGALWTVEHGARGGDEINITEAGKNYGWPVITHGVDYSGASIGVGPEAPGMEQPVHYWDPSIAPSGFTFYQGDWIPEWRGNVFTGALAGQMLVRLAIAANGVVSDEERLFVRRLGRIRDVRSGPDGALWILTDATNGALYRIAPVGAN